MLGIFGIRSDGAVDIPYRFLVLSGSHIARDSSAPGIKVAGSRFFGHVLVETGLVEPIQVFPGSRTKKPGIRVLGINYN